MDVVFEVRFSSTVAGSNLIPGQVLSKLPEYKNIERLPAADIPEIVRNSDQGLLFAPLVRMRADRFSIFVGDKSLSVTCHMPYVGWGSFYNEILRITQLLLVSEHISKIHRFALRYVNMFELPDAEDQVAAFNWRVRLGDHAATNQRTLVRMEIQKGEQVHAVQIGTGVVAQTASGAKNGALVDIDSYSECDVTCHAFLEHIEQSLGSLHRENHLIFFSVLTDATLASLGPQYD